jgi:hypothetical protein
MSCAEKKRKNKCEVPSQEAGCRAKENKFNSFKFPWRYLNFREGKVGINFVS